MLPRTSTASYSPRRRRPATRPAKPKVYEEIVKKYIAGRPEHEWYVKGFDPKRVEEIKQYYQERYHQKVQ